MGKNLMENKKIEKTLKEFFSLSLCMRREASIHLQEAIQNRNNQKRGENEKGLVAL